MPNQPEPTRTSVGRRSFLAAGAALGACITGSAQTQRDWSGMNPTRYPDPDIITLDPSFKKYALGNTGIQRLWTGAYWAEGPAWSSMGQFLVWSDIPNDRQMRLIPEDGHVSVYRKPSGFSNGNTFDYQGRQLSCEHANRRVVRYEADGSATVIASAFQGKRFNAPNDIVVHPDGGIWFSDPGYGALANYEGNKGPLEMKEAVYRVDPQSGSVTKVTDDLFKPNGLCFSPDYKKLYICDTGSTHYPESKNLIQVYDVADGKTLRGSKQFISMEIPGKGSGLADGLRADKDGNLWVGAGWVGAGYDGVHIFSPEGKRIGQILLPEICANLCFGGPRRNRLFMAASQSIYAVYVEAQGAHIA
jgi:gluconolactonase